MYMPICHDIILTSCRIWLPDLSFYIQREHPLEANASYPVALCVPKIALETNFIEEIYVVL